MVPLFQKRVVRNCMIRRSEHILEKTRSVATESSKRERYASCTVKLRSHVKVNKSEDHIQKQKRSLPEKRTSLRH